MKQMLHTENLTVGYGKKIILENLSFEIHAGEILTFIGANGAGKSTVLKSIANQLQPIAGTVYLKNQDMRTLSGKEIAKQLSVFLTHRIDPELMTCEDVVISGRYPYTGRFGILSASDWQKVDEAFALVNASAFRYQDFQKISDGQRQRIMLARAICQEPAILILDEPTSFLDIRHKVELLSMIQNFVHEKKLLW